MICKSIIPRARPFVFSKLAARRKGRGRPCVHNRRLARGEQCIARGPRTEVSNGLEGVYQCTSFRE